MTHATIYPDAFVYIAGAFRATTAYNVRLNIRAAEARSLHLYRHGIPHFCPHTQSANFDGAAPDDLFLEIDKAIIRTRCTHILTVPGWENSVGSRAEVELGKSLSIPVYHDMSLIVTDIQEAYHAGQSMEVATDRRPPRVALSQDEINSSDWNN